jgi:hypothetical protein
MWKGLQNYASGVRERMSGGAPLFSGIPGMQDFKFTTPQGAPGNMAYRTPVSLIEAFQKGKALFGGGMQGPVNMKYQRTAPPNYGPGAPTPYGNAQAVTPFSFNKFI